MRFFKCPIKGTGRIIGIFVIGRPEIFNSNLTGIRSILTGIDKNSSICIHDPEVCILKSSCRIQSQGNLIIVRIFYSLPDFLLGCDMAGCAVKRSTGSFFQLFFYKVRSSGGKQQKADSSDGKIEYQQFAVKMLFHQAFTSNL